jgi:glycerol-3-phosphate O-acyltransferase/dihydroxyacetone phosphate acyltransferase
MTRYLFKTSLLYCFLKIFIGEITLKLFFRKIHIHGLDNIPDNKPVILASNHANAFMDALVIKATVTRPVYSLVRSDVFNTPFKLWLLSKMNMMPIYRMQEGTDQLHKNEEVFRKCYRMLGENKCLVIFAEGNCVQERRLRRLKKGTARIAFGAEVDTKFGMDLQVICVGLSYDRPTRFRSEVHIRFSKPIEVQPYKEAYEKDPARVTLELTRRMEEGIAEQMVIIANKDTDTLVSHIEEMYKKELLEEYRVGKGGKQSDFDITRGIASAVNYFYKEEPELVLGLDTEMKDYFSRLYKYGFRDHLLKEGELHKSNPTYLIAGIFLLFIGFPFHLIGLINNYLPYKLPSLLAKKVVRNIEFYTSINFGAGAFLFLIFYILQITTVQLIFHNWEGTLIYAVVLPLTAFFSFHYLDFYKKTKGRKALHGLKKNEAKKFSELVTLRIKILETLKQGKFNYLRTFPCD